MRPAGRLTAAPCGELARCGASRAVLLLGAFVSVWLAAAEPAQGQAEPERPTLSPADQRRSGFSFMSPSTQALQRDDGQNPAMLWVRDGERLWRTAQGPAAGSCATCHGDATQSMRGVAARYPAWDRDLGRVVGLPHRISLCRERHQGAAPAGPEFDEGLALEALIARQSRGLPIAAVDDPRLQPALEQGRNLYQLRIGQMALSCRECHDQRAGERLAGSLIPQGHPTAYPIYRLQWQSLGTLSRRLRGCFTGVLAEPPEAYSEVMTALELFLRDRAAGMLHEGPGVRP